MGGAPYIGPRLVGGPADIQGISIAVRVPGKLPMGSSYRIAGKFGGLAVNCNRQIKIRQNFLLSYIHMGIVLDRQI